MKTWCSGWPIPTPTPRPMPRTSVRRFSCATSPAARLSPPGEHRRAWLLRVTINRCKSHLSSWWVRHTVPLEDRIPISQPEYLELHLALEQLQKSDRLLLHLFYYEDLTTREISRLLRCTEGAVRTRLSRARQRLGDLLKG